MKLEEVIQNRLNSEESAYKDKAKPVDWTNISTPPMVATQSEAYGYNKCRQEIIERISEL